MNPLISIIVPVYKVEKYLERCIDSLINQTYKEIEIILIYDHRSPDKCPQICNDFAIKFKNIQVVHQEDSGPSAARNAGIDIANGKYLAFVDSDDFVDSTLIEFLKSEMDNNDVLLSICGYEKIPNSIVQKNKKNLVPTSLKINDSEAFEFLLNNQELCAPWAKLYNVLLFKDLRFPITMYEDMFIMPQIFKKAKQISISFNKLYYYNQEGTSLVRSPYNYRSVSQYFEASQFWNNFASTKYPEHSEKATLFHFRNILNLCKEIRLDKSEDFRELYEKYKSLILNQILQLLLSKNFPIREKVKLILLKINFY